MLLGQGRKWIAPRLLCTVGYLDWPGLTPLPLRWALTKVESLEMRGPDGPHPARAWVDLLVHVDLALLELVIRKYFLFLGIIIQSTE